ncbi:hypothetical protein N7983_27410 [Priestia megaterium]|uniref:hypothetical protein n=1 Tax=Priestia megaterium TaxID=1404 RepID=UPI0021D67D5F|nr:hypothetical protein [Priestia megaterium]MCU7746806.1 hypothetical protein [Priestia megaterium]
MNPFLRNIDSVGGKEKIVKLKKKRFFAKDLKNVGLERKEVLREMKDYDKGEK